MRSMKILTTFAFIFLAACAGAPPKTDPNIIEPPVEAGSADANQSAADRRFAEETRGYKQVERNGQTFYCRSERASGSNLRTMNCFSEAELRARVENAEMYRRRSKSSVCAPNDPRCGGA